MKTNHPCRHLFIKDWFGPQLGGAENFLWDLCRHLSYRGAEIEVWSSTSKNLVHRDRQYPSEIDNNIPFTLKRFPTVLGTDKLFYKIHDYINRGYPSFFPIELLWKWTNIRAHGLKKELIHQQHKFDSIHLCHYLGSAPYLLAHIAPEKTILHPWFHDEPFLYLSLVKNTLDTVKGVFTSSQAEQLIAARAGVKNTENKFHTIGVGLEFDKCNTMEFPNSLQNPFILYIGRLIREKNLVLLKKWFIEACKNSPDFPRLILVGDGDLFSDLAKSHPKIEVRGKLCDVEKQQLLKNARALVQLSTRESFSLVLMEAWLENTPVVVHGDCEATRLHVATSGGGYVVTSAAEFQAAIDSYHDAEKRWKMGSCGRKYVTNEYNWDRVCYRFYKGLKKFKLPTNLAYLESL